MAVREPSLGPCRETALSPCTQYKSVPPSAGLFARCHRLRAVCPDCPENTCSLTSSLLEEPACLQHLPCSAF